ncbi:MAG: winged helix-turn-helix domain-containing protein [Pseudomonadota bacterium]
MTISQFRAVPFAVGRWRVDPGARAISDGVVEKRLSPRAFAVLFELCAADGQTVGRDALLDAVWPNVTVTDESLSQAVAELRRAFRGGDDNTPVIGTVAKAGYRLLVETQPLDGSGPPVGEQNATLSIDAYIRVLDSRTALARGDRDAVQRATHLSAEAIAIAPNAAMAQAQHAISLAHKGLYGGGTEHTLLAAAQHGHLAVSRAPECAISHSAYGFALASLGRHAEAGTFFARSIELGDRDGEGHYLAARSAFAAGRHREAATLAMRAAELTVDPARALFLAARAAKAFDSSLSYRISAICRRGLESQLALNPDDPRSCQTLGPVLALLGHSEAAYKKLCGHGMAASICQIHDTFAFATMGEHDRALDALASAVDDGYRDHVWLAQEPMVQTLRKDSRYQQITRSLHAA